MESPGPTATALEKISRLSEEEIASLPTEEIEGLRERLALDMYPQSDVVSQLTLEALGQAAKIAAYLSDVRYASVPTEGPVEYALDLQQATLGTYLLSGPSGFWPAVRAWLSSQSGGERGILIIKGQRLPR